MKIVVALVAMMIPVGVSAQAQSGQYSNAIGGFATSLDAPRDFSTFDPNRSAPFNRVGTAQCTVSGDAQQERISRAIALRTEATNLLNRDGGSLSRWSEERIRRKASAILSYGC